MNIFTGFFLQIGKILKICVGGCTIAKKLSNLKRVLPKFRLDCAERFLQTLQINSS